MQQTIETKSGSNLYVNLAERCYRGLQELTASMDPTSEAMLEPAMIEFWRRLAWADLMLANSERAIFEAIFPEAKLEAMANHESDENLRAYLRRVAAYDTIADSPIGRKVASQIESFGYALLAADRDFDDHELEVLQSSMRRVRGILFPSGG